MKITLKEQAYDILKEMIVSGQIKSGEFLTERALVEKLEMSRTPIRAALERLEVEGLVNYSPNRGLSVAELSVSKVRDVYDFREAIECHVIKRLCMRHLSEAEREKITANLQRQKNCIVSGNVGEFVTNDADFHILLSTLNGNEEIVQAMIQIHSKINLLSQKVMLKDPNRPKISYQEHTQIFEYLLKKDSHSAINLMEKHLEIGKQMLLM